ncbi:winged helix-turn-helix domain-containing protein [Aeromonas hydrophila]|uniref:winged helix-turn-helix domain-containing protein n=1 Tax=Aeromonas hydrophila TaxID=644 RepID=UPI002B4789A5|nr:winged helix-turn-helix domain-containing protein [Aeromonas hydrophila]
MKITYWKRIPSTRFVDDSVLRELHGGRGGVCGHRNVGAKISALMLYIALGLCAEEEEDDGGGRVLRASPTYDELQELSGLSRPLISTALSVLDELKLIEREPQGRGVSYVLTGYSPARGWCKVPFRAISKKVNGSVQIEPFRHFKKRGLMELYALKLFLYLLAIRDNETSESKVSYELISERTAIPRSAIRKTGSFLLSSGLLSNIYQSSYQNSDGSEGDGGSNKYCVTGFKDLLVRR